MIPCQNCGHENPLGTLFCHSCGERLSISANQIMGSVAQTKATNLSDKIFSNGVAALTMGGFALFSVIVLRAILLPPEPAVLIPPTPPIKTETIFDPATTDWGSKPTADKTTAEEIVWIGPIGVDEGQTLLAWRQGAARQLLDPFGVDFDRLRHWQHSIVAQQNESGSFPGADRTAATALAALALQAFPGDPKVDAAAAKAREHLRRNLRILTQGQGSDLARTLATWALYEADGPGETTLDTLRSNLLANGKRADWQTLAIAHLKPADRPKSLIALKQAGKGDPLITANLSILGLADAPTADSPLNTTARVDELDGFERLSWAHWQWLQLGNLDLLAERLQSWSKTADPFPAPATLSAQTGAHTDFALAVLSCTVPAQAPVQWNAATP